MGWEEYPWFCIATLLFWAIAAATAFGQKHRKATLFLGGLGIGIQAFFLIGFWIHAQRPPLASLGETRLWYVFFLLLLGWFVFYAFRYRWIPVLSLVLALVFSLPNLLKPELHTQGLMPVLQSFWFIPHVILYIFAYSLLAISFLLSIYGLSTKKGRCRLLLEHIDRLSRLGTLCLLSGICLGCIWAKQAWGDWWTWDPKETWAAATWLSYLLYLHLRAYASHGRIISSPDIQGRAGCPVSGSAPHVSHDLLFALLVFSFILLQMCWYGINYLPSAQGASIHVY